MCFVGLISVVIFTFPALFPYSPPLRPSLHPSLHPSVPHSLSSFSSLLPPSFPFLAPSLPLPVPCSLPSPSSLPTHSPSLPLPLRWTACWARGRAPASTRRCGRSRTSSWLTGTAWAQAGATACSFSLPPTGLSTSTTPSSGDSRGGGWMGRCSSWGG